MTEKGQIYYNHFGAKLEIITKAFNLGQALPGNDIWVAKTLNH